MRVWWIGFFQIGVVDQCHSLIKYNCIEGRGADDIMIYSLYSHDVFGNGSPGSFLTKHNHSLHLQDSATASRNTNFFLKQHRNSDITDGHITHLIECFFTRLEALNFMMITGRINEDVNFCDMTRFFNSVVNS
ncbi:hypothetical protein ACJX0J_022555 [Zea mays]